MRLIETPLLISSLGSGRTVSSLHFGVAGQGQKVYIQSSLHADEIPGMLVTVHLREMLLRAEQEQRIRGEVILVPVANPIGLAQRVHHQILGRFELSSGENFNRHYPNFAERIWEQVRLDLGSDPLRNVARIREALRGEIARWAPETELQGLRKALMAMAVDADLVLDLHCDVEACLHFYAEEPCWPGLKPLSDLLGSEVVLLSRQAQGQSFDEALSGPWWQLAEMAQRASSAVPVPQACLSATLELRGKTDVTHELAQKDARAIMAYLIHTGAVAGEVSAPPEPKCRPTPLAGSMAVCARSPGVVVFVAEVGSMIREGDVVAQLINPISGDVGEIRAEVEGVFYARSRERYVLAGGEIGKIACAKPLRTGPLLGV